MTLPRVHSSLRDILTPEYLHLSENVFLNRPPFSQVTAQQRREENKKRPKRTHGMQTAHDVMDTAIERAHTKGDAIPIRIWTPHSPKPDGGYPAVIHIHGGGWALGDLDQDAVHCSNMCARVGAVVISVDYRLAPEFPYPAGTEDVWESYRWVLTNAEKLQINPDRIAVGGGSAGANLSAVLVHKVINYNNTAAEKLPSIKYALLYVPSVDVMHEDYWTASVYEHAPDLDPDAIQWFTEQYFGSGGRDNIDVLDVNISPIKNPDENFRIGVHPPVFIATAETDVLRGQGEAYASKLMRHGVAVSYKMYKGVGHAFTGQPGVIPECDELILDLCKHLRAYFYGEPKIDV